MHRNVDREPVASLLDMTASNPKLLAKDRKKE